MTNFKSVRIFWYSGTGNSFVVAEKIANTFATAGVETNIVQINSTLHPEIAPGELIGLVFPVAAAGTYPFIWEFFNRLPRANNLVFMADTLGSYSGGIKGPLAKVLRQKGYQPYGAIEIKMPTNFPPGREITENSLKLIAPGLEKAKEFAKTLLDGTARWSDIPVWSAMLGAVCRLTSPWKLMRKVFKLRIDPDKCTKCGLCVQLCPVINFHQENGGIPMIKNLCQSCMRCIAFCPVGAITTKAGKRMELKSCNVDELLASTRHF